MVCGGFFSRPVAPVLAADSARLSGRSWNGNHERNTSYASLKAYVGEAYLANDIDLICDRRVLGISEVVTLFCGRIDSCYSFRLYPGVYKPRATLDRSMENDRILCRQRKHCTRSRSASVVCLKSSTIVYRAHDFLSRP